MTYVNNNTITLNIVLGMRCDLVAECLPRNIVHICLCGCVPL